LSITSWSFAGFVLLVLVLYYLLPAQAQIPLLLVGSYAFCLLLGVEFVIVLVLLTLAGFWIGRRLEHRDDSARPWLWTGIALNLLALAFFKYADFFVPRLTAFLTYIGLPASVGGLQILLPIGLSYYTLQSISYLVDVYQGKSVPTADLVGFALYMAYFPRLVAGPIERAGEFLGQLARPRIVDNGVVTRSLSLILIGLVRKLVVADVLASLIPAQAFRAPAQYSAPQLAGWLVALVFSIYNDFAGYTSLVRGVSGLFGIELSSNFNLPFFSRSFAELWTRWHITLSQWLRDYIYYPISRRMLRRDPSGEAAATLFLPPLATMLASGLWHGAYLGMLTWGAVNGVFMGVERAISLARPSLPLDRQPAWRQWAGRVLVFTLVTLSLVPFRTSPGTSLQFFRQLLTWKAAVVPDWRLLIPIGLGSFIDWSQFLGQDELAFLRWPRWAQAGLLALAVLCLFLVSWVDIGAPFIYQEF